MHAYQVYGLALYVERQPAAAELARLKSEGFFDDGDYGVEKMCSAIAAIKCNKVGGDLSTLLWLSWLINTRFTSGSRRLSPNLSANSKWPDCLSDLPRLSNSQTQ